MDKKVRKMQKKIRKLTWHQKLCLMDWINAWYQGYKEDRLREYNEWYGEEE